MKTRRPKSNRPLIIGHRGARGLAPENTIAGFLKAMEYDIDMIEFDVRQTKDGRLIVIHKHLRAPDGHGYVVKDTDYAELLARDPAIPTFEEVIEAVNHRVRLMVEIKPGVPPEPVAAVVRKYLARGWKPEEFMFNSSSYRILKYLYDALPQIERIIQGNWSGLRVAWLARRLHTPYILLDQRYLWRGYVWLASRRYRLITYTYPWHRLEPYNHHKAIRWARYGLYGLVTDYPDHYARKLAK